MSKITRLQERYLYALMARDAKVWAEHQRRVQLRDAAPHATTYKAKARAKERKRAKR
jgi:hypothetical protein